MVNLGKTFSAVRAALERFYSDTCTVYVQQEAESDDCLTRFEIQVPYADQPERQAVHLPGAGHPAGQLHRRPAAR